MRQIIVYPLLLTLFFISCEKDVEDNDVNTSASKISQSLHPFLFDKGSYWIYRNVNSGVEDSMTVTNLTRDSFQLGPSGPGQGPQGDEEFFTINYLTYPDMKASKEELLGYVITRGHTSGGYTLLSSKRKGDTSLNATILDILDSLKVENYTYYDVVKMKISADQYISNDYNFYYVDNIGVIKKELVENDSITDTWNLLRYETVMLNY